MAAFVDTALKTQQTNELIRMVKANLSGGVLIEHIWHVTKWAYSKYRLKLRDDFRV